MDTLELIVKAKSGDADAFAALITSRQQRLYRIARSYLSEQMDIDDAVSETILSCWEQLRSLRSPEYFETWLVRILINNCHDIHRRSSRILPLDSAPEQCSCSESDMSRLEFDELVGALDERYRPVFVLYYSEGFRIRDISHILGISEGTIGSWLLRGREQLRRLLMKGGIE